MLVILDSSAYIVRQSCSITGVKSGILNPNMSTYTVSLAIQRRSDRKLYSFLRICSSGSFQ